MNARLGRGPGSAPAAATAALTAVAILVLLPAAGALAEVSGRCGAALNGVNAATVDSEDPDTAISLFPGDRAVFALVGDVPVRDGEFRLHYGFLSRPIGGEVTEGDTMVGSAVVDDYDWMGGGLYRVTGEATLADGSDCEGAMLVNFVLDDPLTTLLGAVGATFAAAGLLGVFGSSLHDRVDAVRSMRSYREAIHASSPGGAISSGSAAAGEAMAAGAAAAGSAAAGAGEARADLDPAAGGFMVSSSSDSAEEAVAAGAVAGVAGAAGARGRESTEEDDAASMAPPPREAPAPESARESTGVGGGGPGGGAPAGAGSVPEPPRESVEFGLPEEVGERVLDPSAFEEPASIPPGEEDDQEDEEEDDEPGPQDRPPVP